MLELHRGPAGAQRPQAGAEKVNLHVHSFYSYNALGYSPSHIVWRAAREGLSVVGLVALLGFLVWQRFFAPPGQAAFASAPAEPGGAGGPLTTPVMEYLPVGLTPFATPIASFSDGVARKTNLMTIIPNRPRDTVITYTVQYTW